MVGLTGSLVLPHRNLLFPDISRAIELLDKLQKTGEVPPQKLQALQRVLQSEFCNAVREVTIVLFIKQFWLLANSHSLASSPL